MMRSIGSHTICTVIALFCGAFLSRMAAAAPPANDDYTNAVVIGPGSYSGTLLNATNDGSSSVGSVGQPDVWYRFTAAGTGSLYVDTCGTNDAGGLDTTVSLHSNGPGTTANELADASASCCGVSEIGSSWRSK